jgi:hypothetical protein
MATAVTGESTLCAWLATTQHARMPYSALRDQLCRCGAARRMRRSPHLDRGLLEELDRDHAN